MTVTADAPAAAPASESTAPVPAPAGLAAILGSGDHKVIGRLWLVAAMAHLLLVGVVTILVSAERIDSSTFEVVGSDWILQADTFRFIGAAFLVLLPLTIGVATAIVPLQVGAATIAFPRAAAAAAWAFLIGGGLLLGAYAIDGGPGGTDLDGVSLFLVAFGMVVVAQVVAWICILATVITLRTPGMGLRRVPPFAWSAVVAGGVWILTLPVLVALTVLSYLDVGYGGFLGGDEGALYDRISWVFAPPALYALAVPALGLVASVVPVAFRTRHHQHRVALGLIGAFGVLSVGAWTAPSLSGDLPWLYEGPWVAMSLLAVLPVLGLLGLWLLTARQGALSFSSPLLFAVAAGVLLLLGTLAGAVHAIEPVETLVDGAGTPLYGTSWTTGVSALVLLAGIVAMFGAIVHWAPMLLGSLFAEAGARLAALLVLLGTVVSAGAELVSGLLGQPASAALAAADRVGTLETLAVVVTVGDAVLVLGGLLFVVLLVRAALSGVPADPDPWSGHTLEWATAPTSPAGDAAALPEITSEAPLYDARHRSEEAEA